jgi:hypothetical protein
MTIDEVRSFPTCFHGYPLENDSEGGIPVSYTKAHESLLRSFQIVQKVKELLQKETQPSIILELIEFMESK